MCRLGDPDMLKQFKFRRGWMLIGERLNFKLLSEVSDNILAAANHSSYMYVLRS